MLDLTSHVFSSVAGCSPSCDAVQFWSSGFTVLQASIDAAIIQVKVLEEGKGSYDAPRLYHLSPFHCCHTYQITSCRSAPLQKKRRKKSHFLILFFLKPTLVSWSPSTLFSTLYACVILSVLSVGNIYERSVSADFSP